MPRIRSYDNKENIDPSMLSYAAQGAARAGEKRAGDIRTNFNQARDVVHRTEEHIALNETTKLAADMATAQAELTEQWRQTVSNGDPNDPDMAEKFQNDVVKPRLDALGDGLLTMQSKTMFEKASASMFGDFYVKTAADQANLSATAAAQNVVSMTNDLSMSVRNDPVGWQNSVALANAAIDGMVQIPVEARLKLKTAVGAQVAESAILGMAKENPPAAIAAINSGEFKDFVPADKAEQYIAHAEAIQSAQEANQRQAQVQAEKEQKALSEATETDVTRKFVNGEDVAGWEDNPNLTGDQIRTITRFMNAPESSKSDPTTWSTLYQRVYSGDPISEAEIRDNATNGKITKQDAQGLVDLLSGKKGADWNAVSMSRSQIDNTAKVLIGKADAMGFMDPEGQQRYLDWALATNKIVLQKMEDGVKAQELYDPDSPNYILKLNPFTNRSSSERLQAGNEQSKTLAEQLRARKSAQESGKPVDPNGPRVLEGGTASTHSTGGGVSFNLRKQDGESPIAFVVRRTSGGDVDMGQYNRDQTLWDEVGMDRNAYGRLRDAQYTHEQIKAMTPEARNRASKGD